MNSRPKLLGFYLPIFLALTACAVTLRTIAAIKFLDAYGYYSEKLLFNLSTSVAIVSVIFFLTYMLFEKKDIRLIPSFSSPASYAPAAAVAVALVLIGVHLFDVGFTVYTRNMTMRLIAVGTAILAIASAFYFTVSAFITRRRSMKRADLGIVMLVFICFYIAFLYFDTALPINAPNKIIDQMAYLGASLFFLYETRLSLGREKWRAYISCGFIAAFLLAYSSIPTLILYFVNGRVMSDSIYEAALSFALFFFVLSKLLLITVLVEDKESPVVTKIIAAAQKRSEELANAESVLTMPKPQNAEGIEEGEEAAETDENQISIADIASIITASEGEELRISSDTADAIESLSFTEDTEVPETFDETKSADIPEESDLPDTYNDSEAPEIINKTESAEIGDREVNE